jgi:hypothetical protein
MNGNQDAHPHDLISALADGELSAAQRLEAESHLERCEPCRELLADICRLRSAIAAEEPPPVPERLVSQVGWRLRAASAGREDAARRGRWRFAWPPLAVGSLAAAAVLAFLFLRHDLPQEARIVSQEGGRGGRGGGAAATPTGELDVATPGQARGKESVTEMDRPALPAPPVTGPGETPGGERAPVYAKKVVAPPEAPSSAFAPVPAPAPPTTGAGQPLNEARQPAPSAFAAAPAGERDSSKPIKTGSADEEGALRAPLATKDTSVPARSTEPPPPGSPAGEAGSGPTDMRDAAAPSNRAAALSEENATAPSASPGGAGKGAPATPVSQIPVQGPPGSRFQANDTRAPDAAASRKIEARPVAVAGPAPGARTVPIFKDPVVLKCADEKYAVEQVHRLVVGLGGTIAEGEGMRTIIIPVGRIDELIRSLRKIGELRAPAPVKVDPAFADSVVLRLRIER